MPQHDACVACGKTRPAADLDAVPDSTLPWEGGWHLERLAKPTESWLFGWACPDCWEEREQRMGGPGEDAPQDERAPPRDEARASTAPSSSRSVTSRATPRTEP
jgi:hypothetical protein